MYKVMLVDDWEIFRIQFNRKAKWEKQAEFELVYEASNGQDALDYFKENSVDCIITDIRMPVMDGVELLKQIRLLDKDLPVIFLSEYEDFHYAKAAITHQIVDYIVKPVNELDIKELFGRLREKLDQKMEEKRRQSIYHDDLIPLMVDTISCKDKLSLLVDTFTNRLKAPGVQPSISPYLSCLQDFDEALCQAFSWVNNYRLTGPIQVFSQRADEEVNWDTLFKQVILEQYDLFNSLYRVSTRQPLITEISSLILATPKQRTIKDIAESLFMNKNYLADEFKKETGQTLNDYMNQVAVSRAKMLALTSDLKNYEIAHALGFQHADYFCRLFKKFTGETLSDYRKKEHLDFM